MMAMGAPAFFLSSLQFLEAVPKLKCNYDGAADFVSCKPPDYCKLPDDRRFIDWNDPESFNNLIMHFDLLCADSIKIGLFGSVFILGNVLGSISLSRMGDLYGRKPVLIAGLLIYTSTVTLTILVSTYYIACVFSFGIGFSLTAKQYIGFSYLLEMHPMSKYPLIGCAEFIWESIINIFITVYFAWIDKNWYYMLIPSLAFGLVGSAI